MKKIDVSIIIGAYNEEENISAAISSVTSAVEGIADDYEIIVVDDGSTDATSQRVKNFHGSKIRLITRSKNMGLGYSFIEGLKKATKKYVTCFPGDNDMSAKSLRKIIESVGNYDLVVTYPKDRSRRSFLRNVLSAAYVQILNVSFGLRLKYFNGPFICKREMLSGINLISSGHSVFAELVIRLIRDGVRYIEIPFEHIGRTHGRSKAFTFTNIVRVGASFIMLFTDIYIRKNGAKA